MTLTGFTVAVTAERRRDELTALLERRGARVVGTPAVTIVPLSDDAALHAATEACVARPPDVVVATTGIGFRGWLEAAEGWGLGGDLRAVLGSARVLARGSKARGAIRAAGLAEHWHAESEACEEVLTHLLAGGVAGLRVAVQLHGDPQAAFVTALRAAGADVVEVPVYRCVLPADPTALLRLADLIAARHVDAVLFTSAAAVTTLLDLAGPALVAAFDHGVLAACVGPVTAAPLHAMGVATLLPERARLGALVRAVADELPRRSATVRLGADSLEVRGHAFLLNGHARSLAPAPMTVLRALARDPGRVVSRAELLGELGPGADGHALEMTVNRLRTGLGAPAHIQTVIKRGYRLRVG